MKPETKGRHCAKCAHTVGDLTQLSDAQLIDLVRTDAMPKCARFTKDQLDRVIALETDRPRLLQAAAVGAAITLTAMDASAQTGKPEPMLMGKMIAPVVLTGEPALSPCIKPKDDNDGVKMGQAIVPLPVDADVFPIIGDTVVPVAPPVITGGLPVRFSDVVVQDVPTRIVHGRLIDEHGEPAPFVEVSCEGTVVATDEKGKFSLPVRDDGSPEDPVIAFHSIGYEQREVAVPIVSARGAACAYAPDASLVGVVVDEEGSPVANVTVEVKTLGLRCITDAEGRFSFVVDEAYTEALTVTAEHSKGAVGSAAIRAGALPRCVSITLQSGKGPAVFAPSPIDMGDIVLRPDREMILGDMSIYIAPTRSQRLLSPIKRLGNGVVSLFR